MKLSIEEKMRLVHVMVEHDRECERCDVWGLDRDCDSCAITWADYQCHVALKLGEMTPEVCGYFAGTKKQ